MTMQAGEQVATNAQHVFDWAAIVGLVTAPFWGPAVAALLPWGPQPAAAESKSSSISG